ncbi:hypothetical protein BZA05DRAFT_473941 [Tricharina praecox]|uniref:uncharacterized protein n=1 Tax=Tricharina praecox TaxID=43433 RepID=UPI0022205A23|nr:uncharacterized protein BZA05DRAFT_473941 [Tricharina praecox]KAI5851794.1 hypothetical protein BZA05DRAFT_473941 [Tricharina praecox]
MIIILLVFAIASRSVAAAEDAGDDMSDNLFSDLAPLLTLFGEQFAKQYMSQSMSWLDNVIFAMAPLGIITAIVGAIRVGGPSWLKALVGRAQENCATVEVELMSSTSHEVCELWNGQGVIRTMGSPEVMQIIYLESAAGTDSAETFGLHTVESALQAGLLDTKEGDTPLTASSLVSSSVFSFSAPPSTRKPPTEDLEQNGQGADRKNRRSASNMDGLQAAPNISLNLHGGTAIGELSPAIQDGVGQWPFPVLATGTIALVIGMFICSAVVKHSTKETKFVLPQNDRTPKHQSGDPLPVATGQTRVEEPKIRTTKPKAARILWLQSSHTVSDQAFDSDDNNIRPIRIHTTPKSPPSSNIAASFMEKLWGFAAFSQNLTVIGTFFGLAGFVLQFQGLRGMNWSASIAQLLAVSLMTAWRAWLRRILTATPIPKQVLPKHEMDWLALWVSRKLGDDTDTGGAIAWPKTEEEIDEEAEELKQRQQRDLAQERRGPRSAAVVARSSDSHVEAPPVERLIWKIVTNTQNMACRGEHNMQQRITRVRGASGSSIVEHSTSEGNDVGGSDIAEGQDSIVPAINSEEKREQLGSPNNHKDAQQALRVRQRLGQLTRWEGPATQMSVAMARSIAVVLDTLFSGEDVNETESFYWFLNVQLHDRDVKKIERIKFRAYKNPGENWKADATEIEAALSLWLFHIREIQAISRHDRTEEEDALKGSGKENDWLQKDVELSQKVVRLLGLDTASLQRDIGRWVGIAPHSSGHSSDAIIGTNDKPKGFPGFLGPIGFLGLESTERTISGDSQQSALTVDCNASLESLLAQHIFTAFMWSMAIDMRVRFDDDSSILSCKDYRVEDSDTLLSLRLESKTLAEMTEGIQGTGLCSLLEAYICIIPPLSSAKRLPVRAVVDFARQQRKGPELLGLWEKVVPQKQTGQERIGWKEQEGRRKRIGRKKQMEWKKLVGWKEKTERKEPMSKSSGPL